MQSLQHFIHRSRGNSIIVKNSSSSSSSTHQTTPTSSTIGPSMITKTTSTTSASSSSSSSSLTNTLQPHKANLTLVDSNHPSSSTNNTVEVICRLRPRLSTESTADQSVVEVINDYQIRITDPHKHLVNRFDFTACYDHQSTQGDIYNGQVHEMVTQIFNGTTATIFAFGCTGSGKTHTLQGSPKEPGITPRAIRSIFEHVERSKSKKGIKPNSFQISISCYEIWKDKVWDLLLEGGTANTRDLGRGDLPIRESATGQILIPNLRHVTIKSINQFDKLYAQVMRFRSVSSTKLNNTSSRSHAILTINVHFETDDDQSLHGKCVLIDLAGSENNKKTGNELNKERMKESVEINQSLLALRKVVRSLNAGDNRIPYRDSKLTRILSDSLGGTSAGLVICNVAPGASQYRDTMNTLTFGSHSRNVENKALAKTSEASDRKFLLPSLSLYQYQSKSTPNLIADQSPTTTSRSSIKISWSRRPILETKSKLPTTPCTTTFPTAAQPVKLSQRTRALSSCIADPASPPPILRLGHRKKLSNGTPSLNLLSVHSIQYSKSNEDLSRPEHGKQVEEAIFKNLDEIVQNRVDALLKAKLEEAHLKPSASSTIMQKSYSSPNRNVLPTIGEGLKINLENNEHTDEQLAQRIANLEQQFASISNLLQTVSSSTTPRPKSDESKIPGPKHHFHPTAS